MVNCTCGDTVAVLFCFINQPCKLEAIDSSRLMREDNCLEGVQLHGNMWDCQVVSDAGNRVDLSPGIGAGKNRPVVKAERSMLNDQLTLTSHSMLCHFPTATWICLPCEALHHGMKAGMLVINLQWRHVMAESFDSSEAHMKIRWHDRETIFFFLLPAFLHLYLIGNGGFVSNINILRTRTRTPNFYSCPQRRSLSVYWSWFYVYCTFGIYFFPGRRQTRKEVIYVIESSQPLLAQTTMSPKLVRPFIYSRPWALGV